MVIVKRLWLTYVGICARAMAAMLCALSGCAISPPSAELDRRELCTPQMSLATFAKNFRSWRIEGVAGAYDPLDRSVLSTEFRYLGAFFQECKTVEEEVLRRLGRDCADVFREEAIPRFCVSPLVRQAGLAEVKGAVWDVNEGIAIVRDPSEGGLGQALLQRGERWYLSLSRGKGEAKQVVCDSTVFTQGSKPGRGRPPTTAVLGSREECDGGLRPGLLLRMDSQYKEDSLRGLRKLRKTVVRGTRMDALRAIIGDGCFSGRSKCVDGISLTLVPLGGAAVYDDGRPLTFEVIARHEHGSVGFALNLPSLGMGEGITVLLDGKAVRQPLHRRDVVRGWFPPGPGELCGDPRNSWFFTLPVEVRLGRGLHSIEYWLDSNGSVPGPRGSLHCPRGALKSNQVRFWVE